VTPAPTPNIEKPVRFPVRSLGWVRIAEEDLTPERSSRAVNKCIVDLSLGRNDINDVVGRWGDVRYHLKLFKCHFEIYNLAYLFKLHVAKVVLTSYKVFFHCKIKWKRNEFQ